jgi:LysM repeat protein
MGWKKFKKRFKKALKKAVPKVTVGKDLGTKNIGKVASNVVKATGKAGEDIGRGVGKGATAAYKTAGKYGSALAKTIGKGTEGIIANTADLGENLAQGDFKGMGSEALQLVQSGKDVVKGLAKAQGGLATGALGAVGSSLSDKNITGAAKNIEREQNKGVDKYGDAAIDVGISAIPGVGQAYALGKAAAGGLSQGGLKGLTSAQGLTDMALGAAASKFNINPNLLTGAKMGLSASQGDLKGAALQGLGSFAGLTPDQMKMATTGAAALTGDKRGLASGLASQFGAGDSVANMMGAVAGGKKGDIANALGGQLGLDPKMANMLGAVAGGDIKGAALSQLAGATGLDPKLLSNLSSGKIDPMQLAGAAGFDPKSILGGAADKLGISSFTKSPEAQAAMEFGRGAGRVVESADAYVDDAANQALDRAGLSRDQVRGIQDVQKAAESTYKIARGDTLAAIAKKMGVDPAALAAANNIKDPNKIMAGMNLKIPSAVNQASRSVAGSVEDLSGEIQQGVVESGKVSQQTFDANKAFQDWSKSQTGYIGKEKKAFMQDLFNKRASGQISNDDFVKQMESQGEKGFLDKAKDFFGGAKDTVTGAVGAAGGFIKENPMLATGAIQAGAATAGYMAGDKAREEQEKLLERQILETQGVDALKNYQLSKERDAAYGEQQKFLEERIAGGGMTAKEIEMQEQGRLRAARMAAAGRLAGVEQQARMGQGVTGAGSALAASLAGAQAQAQAGAESERAAATSAAENVERAFAARPAALEAKAKSEMDLAQMKDIQELSKLQQIGKAREAQGTMAAQEGEAKGRLASGLADIATRGVLGQQIGPSDATDKEREITAQAEADRKKRELEAKAAAAGTVSQTAPTQVNAQTAGQKTPPAGNQPPQTQADRFNQAGQAPKPAPAPQPGQGQGYGVLAPTSKPANPADAMMDIVKNPAQAIKNPGQAVQAVQQVANNPQAALNAAKKKAEEAAKEAAKKAAGSIVPDSMKNIFKF